jgi:hypothetical protein
MVKHSEDFDTKFESRLFRHYIIIAGLFLGIVVSLFAWGMSVNTKQAVQDERIIVIQQNIGEMKTIQKEILVKVQEIDKKLPDNRLSDLNYGGK